MAQTLAKLNSRPFNPVAWREMKTRVRGPRTFALVGIHLLLMTFGVLVIYLRKGGSTTYNYGGVFSNSNFGPTKSYETGQDIFIGLFLYLVVLVAVITPAICGSLISKEVEEGTYDLLLVTPLRGSSLVYGKMVAALAYIGLIVLSSLPVTCVVVFFGGVNFAQLAAGYLVVLTMVFLLAAISLFCSAAFRSTSVSIIVTYGLVVLLLLGIPIISSSIVANINNDLQRVPSTQRADPRTDPVFELPKRMLVVNPFAALGSVLAPNAPYRSSNGEDLQMFPNSRLFWGNPNNYFQSSPQPRRNSSGAITNNEQIDAFKQSRKPVLPYDLILWQGYTLLYLLVGMVFLLIAARVVKPVARRNFLFFKKKRVPEFATLPVIKEKRQKPAIFQGKKSRKNTPTLELSSVPLTQLANSPLTPEIELATTTNGGKELPADVDLFNELLGNLDEDTFTSNLKGSSSADTTKGLAQG